MGAFNRMPDEGASALRKMFGLGDATPELKYTYNPDTQTYTQMAKGGKVGSASKRADGIAQRGKTRGKLV